MSESDLCTLWHNPNNQMLARTLKENNFDCMIKILVACRIARFLYSSTHLLHVHNSFGFLCSVRSELFKNYFSQMKWKKNCSKLSQFNYSTIINLKKTVTKESVLFLRYQINQTESSKKNIRLYFSEFVINETIISSAYLVVAVESKTKEKTF